MALFLEALKQPYKKKRLSQFIVREGDWSDFDPLHTSGDPLSSWSQTLDLIIALCEWDQVPAAE